MRKKISKVTEPPDGYDDEVDAFHKSRDRISLEPDENEDGDESLDDEEGVFGLEGDDDEDDEIDEDDEDNDEDEDDDEDDDEAEELENNKSLLAKMVKQSKAMKAKVGLADAEADEEVEAGAASGKRAKNLEQWGRLNDFYDADDVEVDSDTEAPLQEEEEAKRLQRLQAQDLTAEDYGAEESDEDEDEDEDEEGEETMEVAASMRAQGKTKRKGVAAVEQVKKHVGDLTAEEQSRVVMSDAPELRALIDDLKKSLKEVTGRVQPVLKQVKDGELATQKGVSYLEAKHLLLLSYCNHIVFYLLLKAEGRPVKDHPVMKRLVELRTYLEKARPIDKKLQYQMDKLVQLAQSDAPAGGSTAAGDALNFRPNADALVERTGAGADGDGADGMYRPPKIAPAAMDGIGEDGDGLTGTKKERRDMLTARRRAAKSNTLKELAAEINDAPQELAEEDMDGASAFVKREKARMEKRTEQEEELFMRVPMSKAEKKRNSQMGRSVGALSQLADLGDDVQDLVNLANHDDGMPKRKRLEEVSMGGLAPRIAAKTATGDGDIPVRDALGERRNKFRRKADLADIRAEMVAKETNAHVPQLDAPEDEMYIDARARRDAKRKAKVQQQEALTVFPEDEEDAEDRRGLSRQIEKNRGLTPHRSKANRNPRVKLRNKYGDSLKKRRSQVASARQQEGAYGGEATGIKTNISKSRLL